MSDERAWLSREPASTAGGVLDFAPPLAGRAPGTLAMQSSWLAAIYERAWRPLTFGLTTGFRAPGAAEEAALVAARVAGASGPWLDVACGPGRATAALVARAEGRTVVALDSSRAMLELARASAPGATLVRADALSLPFADGAFGAVVTLAALDLFADPSRALAEMARVLAPDGAWVATSFVAPARAARASWASRAIARAAGIRAFTAEELVARAEAAGLSRAQVVSFGRYVLVAATRAR